MCVTFLINTLLLLDRFTFSAERRGFEPRKPFRSLHAFQACLFSHSSIFPTNTVCALTRNSATNILIFFHATIFFGNILSKSQFFLRLSPKIGFSLNLWQGAADSSARFRGLRAGSFAGYGFSLLHLAIFVLQKNFSLLHNFFSLLQKIFSLFENFSALRYV